MSQRVQGLNDFCARFNASNQLICDVFTVVAHVTYQHRPTETAHSERAEDGHIDMQGAKKLGTGMHRDRETLHYVQETWHRHAPRQACTVGQRIFAQASTDEQDSEHL